MNEATARDRIAAALLRDRLSESPQDLAAVSTDNPLVPTAGQPRLVARPRDVDELAAIVRAAAGQDLGLVPISSAAPHQKGGAACGRDYVAVDLAGWKTIDLIDRRNRVARVQPGVTYPELLAALAPHGLTVSTPLAPRAGKSVLASVMDREPTTWPRRQWDVSDPLACAEIVFGTGDRFRTGAAGGPGTIETQRAAGGAQKSPIGPSQTDFQRVVQGAQGAMGIVSWITIRCELKPSLEAPRLIGADAIDRLVPFVQEVQRPWLGEESFILDRTAAAMLLASDGVGDFLNLRASLPPWVLVQNAAGFERLAPERLEQQLADLEDVARRQALNLVKSLGLISAERLLKAARTPAPADFRRVRGARALSIFFLATLDRAPTLIRRMDGLLDQLGLGHDGIGTYVQPVVQNHGCHFEFIVPYNPRDPAEIEKMRTFEGVAVRELIAAGAFFSRPYGFAEHAAFQLNPLNLELLRKIKNVFDPHRVLCPGKFGL